LEMEEGDTIEVYQQQTGGRRPYITCWNRSLISKQLYSAPMLSVRTHYADSLITLHSLLGLKVHM
jgi:hypothetical protein